MAKERNLPSKTTLTTSDYIRVVGSDNASYKQLVSDVKNAMGVTNLENKFPLSAYTGDLNSLTSTGLYPVYGSANLPLGVSIAGVQVLWYSPDWITQIVYPMNPSGRRGHILIRTYYGGETWSDWVEQPTRAEVDALNSKQQIERLSGVDANTLTETGMYYVYNGTNVPSGYCIVLVFHPVNVGSFAQVGLAMNSGSSVPIYTRKYDSSTQTYTNWAQI